ncbi:MAG: FAD:protein FMN transferase [Phycisphaerae bacterium]
MRRKILILSALAVLLCGCKDTKPVKVTGPQFDCMNTMVYITVVAKDEETARLCIEAGTTELRRLSDIFDRHKPASEISRVNQSSGRAVKVCGEVIELLDDAVRAGRLSGGAFDVTIAPLLDLWQSASLTGIRPSPEQIRAAKALVNYNKIIINQSEQTVKLEEYGMSLDLGGIAKGYSLDKTAKLLKDRGALCALINAGGDIVCYSEEGFEPWKVGIQNPDLDPENEIIRVISLANGAIATSGDYYRFYEIGGEYSSHIVNPASGDGAKWFKSVTVTAPTGSTADALATAVSVMGAESGFNMIERLQDVESLASLNNAEESEIQSSGFNRLIYQVEH